MRFDLIILLPGAQHRKVLDVKDATGAKAAFDAHPDKGQACSAFVGVLDSTKPTAYEMVSQRQPWNEQFEPFDANTHTHDFMMLLNVS
jgi:hypothetical protein